jgi:hypothetical protein
MAKEEKKKDPGMVARFFGGMLGDTAKKIEDRKAKNAEAARQADGDYAPARGEGRPEPSKKWSD